MIRIPIKTNTSVESRIVEINSPWQFLDAFSIDSMLLILELDGDNELNITKVVVTVSVTVIDSIDVDTCNCVIIMEGDGILADCDTEPGLLSVNTRQVELCFCTAMKKNT